MHDYLAPMFGDTGATIAQFVITLVVVLLAILLVFWLIRLFTNGRLGNSPTRGRQPRLAVLDALPIDQRRRLILVRRDNVEHLILIGGPADVVVEPGIQRAQQSRRLEPLRTEPAPRPAPAPQNGRVAAPLPAEMVRQHEPHRPEPAPVAEFQPVEPAPQAEAPRAPEFDAPAELSAERGQEARFQQSEPEPAFEPASPSPRAQPQRPIPEPRTGRGFPSFISGNRPRHTPTTADVPAQPMPAPRQVPPAEPIEGRSTGQRPRPYDPRPLLGSQQTPVAPPVSSAAAVDPALAGEFENARQAARRGATPPPVEAADPFAALDEEAERLARFEPIFDVGAETATSAADDAAFAAPRHAAAPAVEPPQPEDEPVEIAEDFIDQAPLPGEENQPPQSPVSDLEKEMARLLGEISGSRKS
ncbi:flagellar biosynthetic protein FliO [Kaistia adipata]|uniref:flagellar biosynthetic protein FliO n=1 Tax=Kaistia adipata TaxID=166954 RepID=UPI0004182581|nr:flagellar biosynthetic protein FliO [Kaistia adipata]